MDNKRISLLSIYALIVIGCGFGLYNASYSNAEFTIKAAIQASSLDEDYIGLMAFKQHVEAASEGRMEVKVFASGQFCSSVPECVGNLQKGVLEMFPTTAGGTGNFFAPAQVLDLPYAFSGDEQAECVMQGPILDKMREQVLQQGLQLRLIGVTNTGGWRNFATTEKQIRSPEDLVGQKIRTTPAKVQQELAKQLGANPTPISWAELYTALATGVVEGSKNGIQDIIGAKLEEHLDYIVLDGHSYMAALWWFSEPQWQTLPADIQQIIQDGFVKQRQVARDHVINGEAASYQLFEQAGGTVYQPTAQQKQAFVDASVNMRPWFIENYGTEWLDALDETVALCQNSPL